MTTVSLPVALSRPSTSPSGVRRPWRLIPLFAGLAFLPSALLLVGFGLTSLPLFICTSLLFAYAGVAVLAWLSLGGGLYKRIPIRQILVVVFLSGTTALILYSLSQHSRSSASYAISASSNIKIVLMMTVPLIAMWLCDRNAQAKRTAGRAIVVAFALAPLTLGLLDVISGQMMVNLARFTNGLRVESSSAISSPSTLAFLISCGLFSSFLALRATRNPIFLGSLALSVLYLLMVQSKGALMINAITLALMIARPWVLKAALWTLTLFWGLSVPLLMVIYSAISAIGLDSLLIRSGAQDLGLATGRTLTWSTALDVLTGSSLQEIVLGHGFMGAIDTQVLSTFVIVFRGVEASVLLNSIFSLHNMALQVAFDIGIVGVLAYLLGLIAAARSADLNSDFGRKAAVALCFFLLWGLNESVGTVYFIFSMLPFLFLISVTIDPVSTATQKNPERAPLRSPLGKFR